MSNAVTLESSIRMYKHESRHYNNKREHPEDLTVPMAWIGARYELTKPYN